MMRPIIGWARMSDAGTLSGSAAATGKPLTALQTKQPKHVWANSVGGGGTTANIVLEFTFPNETPSFNTVALLSTNLGKYATWRVRTAASVPNLTNGSRLYEFGGCFTLSGGTDPTHSFTSTGSLADYTLSVRCRVDTLRACGIAKFSNASTKIEIAMNGSNQIIVNKQTGLILTAPLAWVADEWHTILVTVSGVNAALYIDGAQVATTASAVAVTADAMTLGHTVTNKLLGSIDDVQFWSRGFSAAEALADFQRAGPLAPPLPSLLSYYGLDGVLTNTGTIGGSIAIGGAGYGTGGRFTASPWNAMQNIDGITRRSSLLFIPAGLAVNTTGGSTCLRIDINDDTSSDTEAEAGRLVVGNFFSFRQDFPGTLPSFVDGTQVTTSQGGHTAIEAHTPIPFASVNMRSYSEDEMMVYAWDLMQQRGASKDVLYVRDPDPTNVWRENGMVYGLLQPGMSINIPEYGIYELPLQITGLV